jgi:UV excision repair protein RAD23
MAITNLTSTGFPEAEVRHCLRVAHDNPDIAVELLTNGIPDNVAAAADLVRASNAASPAAAASAAGSAAAITARARNASSSAATGPLQSLRDRPQFNALRRLVQTNPGALHCDGLCGDGSRRRGHQSSLETTHLDRLEGV